MTTAPERLTTVLADRYRIERQLGQGGMATVYLAQDLKHEREVALKVLRPELGALLGGDRFLAEIKITARLDHPLILTLIDSGDVDGFLYYVLPLVRGESLRQKLDREKQLGLDEALAITKQVASALDYAHRQGVIHRDIKPENILLQEGEAVLTDFGIALAVKEAGGDRLTQTGLSLGTPQYMSPEQATGDRAIDGRSDIYSLASVLYEMLAGEPPVTGLNAQAMIAKLLTERPVRVKVVRDSVPDSVDAAIARALSKVPADRFATPGEFTKFLIATTAPADSDKAKRRWLPMAGTVVAAGTLATLATVVASSLRAKAFTPQYEQLTSDGNARSPALSPDGTRLAFVARDCDERKRCTDQLVVRDTGNAGAMTVLQEATIGAVSWAAGGRFLVVTVGQSTSDAHTVSVSALGGTPRSLPGYAGRAIGATDTVIVTGNKADKDGIVWLRVVTASDVVVRDSIPIRRPSLFNPPYPAPRGGRVAVRGYGFGHQSVRLLDRSGRITDSVAFPNTLAAVMWTPEADALVLQVALGAGGDAPAPSVLVRYRVNADGRFVGRADTLMTLERGSQFSALRADGAALLSQGPVEAVVYALERSGPGRLDFRSRRLASSTAGLKARLSRDGATVWLQYGGTGSGASQRTTFMPFRGGPERSFQLPAGDFIFADWNRPVSSALLYAFHDRTGPRLAEVDVATGQSRTVASLPPRISWIFSIPGGGYGIADVSTDQSRIVRPGKPDTIWSASRPPGRAFAIPGDVMDQRSYFEYSPVGETTWVRRVPLDGGPRSPAIAIVANYNTWNTPFADGSVEWLRRDSTRSVAWFHVAPGTTQTVRLGDAPIQGAGVEWSNSDDGKRFIVMKPPDRPDTYLIRNFGDLLKR